MSTSENVSIPSFNLYYKMYREQITELIEFNAEIKEKMNKVLIPEESIKQAARLQYNITFFPDKREEYLKQLEEMKNVKLEPPPFNPESKEQLFRVTITDKNTGEVLGRDLVTAIRTGESTECELPIPSILKH